MYCCFGWAMWCFIIIHSSVCLSLQVQARSQLHRIIFWYNLQLLYLCQCHCVATSIKSPSHKCKNILSALPYTTSATLLRTGSVASSVVYGRSWRRWIIIIHFKFFYQPCYLYFILLFASVCRSQLASSSIKLSLCFNIWSTFQNVASFIKWPFYIIRFFFLWTNHIYVAAGSFLVYLPVLFMFYFSLLFQYLAEAVLLLFDFIPQPYFF